MGVTVENSSTLDRIDALRTAFKQWGGNNRKKSGRELDGQIYDEIPDLLVKKLTMMESQGKGYRHQQQLPMF